jgi:salicylate hydroxylase
VISDGVFSKGKSLISNNESKAVYNNSIAIRGSISKENLRNINDENISLFLGSDFHYVVYPLNKEKKFNFIGVLKYQLTAKELDNYNLLKEETFIKGIRDKIQNEFSTNVLDNINNFKCFPVFVSKGYLEPGKNIFLLGDAFFALPPSFAQGASQSIEGASELFDNIVNNKKNFYDNRATKIKMINRRSKLNQFAFHVSNPVVVFFRNISLRLLVKNKKFLENYLGKIYDN